MPVFLALFFTSLLVAFSGAMMPGPLMATTVSESARRGVWVGPKLIAGHAFLELGLLFALFFGLAPLFKNGLFFIVIALLGGVIMVWMAQGMFRSLPKLELQSGPAAGKPANLYIAGILMSLANPYWIVWWATIGLGYVVQSQEFGFAGVAFFFAGHILGDLIWYSAISFAIGKGRKFFGDKTYRMLTGICASFLVLFAAWLFYSAISKLAG